VKTAFVLGGGGLLGAAEVGMLQALLAAGVAPDLVVGTSIGAVNGAALAADPTPGGVERLRDMWVSLTADGAAGPFGASIAERMRTAVRTRVAIYDHEPFRRLLAKNLPVATFERLRIRFECCAASIERAAETWFTSGPLVPAVLASSSVPGLFPPYRIGDEHYVDGGIVNSIPLDRARKLGAERVFVLQVGRIEQQLAPPSNPLEVGLVAFELARRARFQAALARSRQDLDVHVLPTGGTAPRYNERTALDYRDTTKVASRVRTAYQATTAYLQQEGLTGG
jgi:NTE family protein